MLKSRLRIWHRSFPCIKITARIGLRFSLNTLFIRKKRLIASLWKDRCSPRSRSCFLPAFIVTVFNHTLSLTKRNEIEHSVLRAFTHRADSDNKSNKFDLLWDVFSVYAIYRSYNQARKEKVFIFEIELITLRRSTCIVKKKITRREYTFLIVR